jgi:hypothetical protein
MTILAVLPCKDGDDMVIKTATYTSIQNSQTQHNDANEESCTPFCICACCSTVRTLLPVIVPIGLFTQPVYPAYGELPVAAIREQSLSIWQPPQLG